MGKEKGIVAERERDKLYLFGDGTYIGGLWFEVWSYIHVILFKHKPWKSLRGAAWCTLQEFSHM